MPIDPWSCSPATSGVTWGESGGGWQGPVKATCWFLGLLQPIHHERARECQGSPGSHPGHPSGQWFCVVKSLPGMERSGLEGRRSLCSLTKGIFFPLGLPGILIFWCTEKKEGTRPEGRRGACPGSHLLAGEGTGTTRDLQGCCRCRGSQGWALGSSSSSSSH